MAQAEGGADAEAGMGTDSVAAPVTTGEGEDMDGVLLPGKMTVPP